MNRILVIAVFLSIIWHSFAFILFKIAESYRIQEEAVSNLNVSLQNSDLSKQRLFEVIDPKILAKTKKNFQQMTEIDARIFLIDITPTDQKRKFDILTVDRIYPVKPVLHESILRKKNNSDSFSDFKGGIKLISTRYLENIDKVNNDISGKIYEKPVKYIFNSMPEQRKLVKCSFDGIIGKTIFVKLRFSIDIAGNVVHVFVDKSQGNKENLDMVLSQFRKCKFSPLELDGVVTDLPANNWGSIVFYTE